MCSDPVTFGGGITIAKGGAAESGSAVKYPAVDPGLVPARLDVAGLVLDGGSWD